MQLAFSISVIFVAVLWWIRIIETIGGWNFDRLGVEPHVLFGLVGIVTAPLLHASWEHLLANTAPVLILSTALLYGYPRASRIVIPLVWLGTGLGVWFTGPPAFHLGASGLVMGFIVFLIVAGALRRDRTSIAITCATAFLYGTALVAIVPGTAGPHISYVTHAWGAAIGLVCALVLFRMDPIPPRKPFRWEKESEETEDPLIGDLWRRPPPDPSAEPPSNPLDDGRTDESHSLPEANDRPRLH